MYDPANFIEQVHDSEIDLNLNTIVVLPINTISSDKSQISLAAGLTQDISTSLSRSSKKLNVIKLNNAPDDLEKIAKEFLSYGPKIVIIKMG